MVNITNKSMILEILRVRSPMTSVEVQKTLKEVFKKKLNLNNIIVYLNRLRENGVVMCTNKRVKDNYKLFSYINPLQRILLPLFEAKKLKPKIVAYLLNNKGFLFFLSEVIKTEYLPYLDTILIDIKQYPKELMA